MALQHRANKGLDTFSRSRKNALAQFSRSRNRRANGPKETSSSDIAKTTLSRRAPLCHSGTFGIRPRARSGAEVDR
jgi:hypothetical protein